MRYTGKVKCDFENTIKMMSFNIKKAMYSIVKDYVMKNKKIYLEFKGISSSKIC